MKTPFGKQASGLRLERMQGSPRYRDGEFRNLLEVGAFHPAWGDIHLGPENALKAFTLLGGAHFLPVHWGTFNLAMHDWDEPAEVLLQAANGAPLLMPELGAAVEPSRSGALTPWWRIPGRALDGLPGAEPEAVAPELAQNAPLAWPLD